MQRAIATMLLSCSLLAMGQNSAPLVITTKSPLPNAFVGKNYSLALQASGGKPPYKWKVAGLPNGMTWTSKGVLSGAPKKAGTHVLTVTVTDSAKSVANVTVEVQ